MCIPTTSDQPEKACRFLEALNTDREVRNMMQYGIEREHYRLNEKGRVEILKDTYAGVAYTQGNYFILNTRTDQPEDIWEKYQEFNDSAVPSNILYFEPDLSGLEEEIAQVRKVSEKYYPALMTGSVNVEEYLPRYCEELRTAGIEKIREELQNQLNRWKKNEKTEKQ